MTSGKTPLKWKNAMQNHWNGEPLPVLDLAIKGYKPCELYQWEMRIQFHSRGASMQKHASDVGKKIKILQGNTSSSRRSPKKQRKYMHLLITLIRLTDTKMYQ
eukprot:15358859-Ditylum_brightwellii.AAC.1